MLNPRTGERELCYVTKIDAVTPIEGYDRVELAHVGGWTVVVGKGEFLAGDPAIYFEIDSKLPEVEPFTKMDFLAKKHYKIKTQKMCKSISQGLLMSAANFGWNICGFGQGKDSEVRQGICKPDGTTFFADDESRFLTKELNVTYAVSEDNSRKAQSIDKYKKMAQRHAAVFSKQPFKWLMRRSWGRKFLFVFFGNRRDKKSDWPSWVVKTDEERIQNMPWILSDKSEWIATEKIDGTSTTFTMRRKKGLFKKGYDFYVCSRNVVFSEPNQKCFYDTNVYLEMAEEYHVKNALETLLNEHPEWEWVTIQGETYGPGIQKRDYHALKPHFTAFNFITSADGRFNSVLGENILLRFAIPWVPILDLHFVLPDTIEELLEIATGESVYDTGLREGLVFRSKDGTKSFKAVSNEYLLKYHQ